MSVSARYLLQGAWYAFEQCGLLLHDAVILRDRGRHATAVGLAMIAREEQGKGGILLRLWREVEEEGRTVTMEKIRDACENHGTKQKEAQTGTVHRARPGRVLTLLRTLVKTKPQNSEHGAARRELESIGEIQGRRMPSDSDDTRVRSFYVDPMSGRRPAAMSADEATKLLEHAVNDYESCWHRFQHEHALEGVDPNLAAAVKAWPDRPELPLPPQLDSGLDERKPGLPQPRPSLWYRVRGMVRGVRRKLGGERQE